MRRCLNKIALFVAFTVLLLGGSAGAVSVEGLFKELGIIAPRVRLEAPAFSLTTIDGKRVGLEQFRGRLVVVNFWATFCAPCREEMPSMERLWQRLKGRGLVILAISVDRGSPQRVEEFVEQTGVSFPVLLDPKGKVRREYEIFALPTTYIVGRDGRFLGKVVGERVWDSDGFIELFERLL